RHTRSKRDWSSDVCSSDLEQHPRRAELVPEHGKARREEGLLHLHEDLTAVGQQGVQELRLLGAIRAERKIGAAHGLEPVRRNVQIGRASCRERVESAVWAV